MRKYLLVLSSITQLYFAQQIAWIDTIKGGTSNIITSIVENQGTVFLNGGYGPGYQGDMSTSRTFVSSFSTNGIKSWELKNTSGAGGRTGLAKDHAGNLYQALFLNGLWGNIPQVEGTILDAGTYVIKYSPTGSILWISAKQQPHTIPASIQINQQGNVEVRSRSSGGTASHIYDTAGNLLSVELNPTMEFGMYDQYGNGYQQYGSEIRKYDPAKNFLWSFPIVSGYTGFIVDSPGNCYMVEQGAYLASRVYKLNSSGQVQWVKNYSTECGFSICTDNANLYLSGVYGNATQVDGSVFKKLDPLTGNEVWSVQLPAPDFRPVSVTTAFGSVFTAAKNMDENREAYLVKITDASWAPPSITSLLKQKIEEPVSVFPNPSSGVFTIYHHNKNESITYLKVTDVAGKLIYSRSLKHEDADAKHSIDLSGEPKGTYLLEVTDVENKKRIQKLVIE